jgi:hypothetical protein
MGDSYDLGVLVVHGIGGQKRGDTLIDVAEPLVQSLTDWLGADAVELDRTSLAAPPTGDPAHLRLTIRHRQHVRRVLVAESWWADTFKPPGWWAFGRWLVWGVPFVVFRAADHGISVIDTNEKLDAARLGRRWRAWPLVAWYVAVRLLKNVLSLAIVVLLVLGLLLAGIFAIVPRLRVAILSAQQLLIRYLGDSYCLLTSPVRAEATISQVERDLDWVERQVSRKLAIIAHSQGAELTFRLLARRKAARPIASLITVGSGIAKLRAVGRMHGRRWKALGAYVRRTAAAVLTVAGPLFAIYLDLSTAATLVAAAGAVIAAGGLVTWSRSILKKIVESEKLADDLRRIGPEKAERWLDLWSTSDPVPEGPLPVQELELHAARSIRIANYRSALRDHTNYAQNGEAFAPAVFAELAGLLGWTPPAAALVVVNNSRERRERKSLALVTDRLVIASVVVAAVVLPYVFDERRDQAEDVVDWLGARARSAATWFGEDVQRWLATAPGKYVVAAAALLLAAGIVYGLGAWVWNLFARTRARRLFQPSHPPGAEAVGQSTGLIRRFAYSRIAKHADNIDAKHGWHAHPRRLRRLFPRVRGGLILFGLRYRLRQENLYDTPAPDPPTRVVFVPRARMRRLDGRRTDLLDHEMGAARTHFGRNAPAFPSGDRPSPATVSKDLLARTRFLRADSLNLLAAAWIQFEVHDWMQHRPLSSWGHVAGGPLAGGTAPFERTGPTRTAAPRFVSEQTHWWDASQLYGVDPSFTASLRAGSRVKTGNDLLEAIEAWVFRTPAPVPNFWLGLAVIHELFAREHNAICDVLERFEPDLKGDALFDKARLVNAAVMAKIHTVEWTPAVIAHPTSAHAILATWWGVLGERTRRRVGRIGSGEVLSGIPGSRTHHDGVRYSLTEEFVAVYRMHPLIPDAVTFHDVRNRGRLGTIPFGELAVGRGPASRPRERLADLASRNPPELGFENAIYSLAVECPGQITLHNYPEFLRKLPLPEGGHVDLAARDIERMREAALPRYNNFRRLFRLEPKPSFFELTGGRRQLADEIEAVYDDVEDVDLMVGLFAEPVPDGFAFSDTAFRVFLLMAARRLRSDRFFTIDFTPAVYTPTGYKWVQKRTMKQMLEQHFPDLLSALDGVDNVFMPWHRVA